MDRSANSLTKTSSTRTNENFTRLPRPTTAATLYYATGTAGPNKAYSGIWRRVGAERHMAEEQDPIRLVLLERLRRDVLAGSTAMDFPEIREA